MIPISLKNSNFWMKNRLFNFCGVKIVGGHMESPGMHQFGPQLNNVSKKLIFSKYAQASKSNDRMISAGNFPVRMISGPIGVLA